MKLNIKILLEFFDNKNSSKKGDANALISVFGEEMNAALYKHFRKNQVDILSESVLPGTNKGNRLDRWIVDRENNVLFQCEIKNWSAAAIGGKSLITDADDEKIKEVAKYYWNRELKERFSEKAEQPNGVSKVLLKMKAPEKFQGLVISPLLIYWMTVSAFEGILDPFSEISVKVLENLPDNVSFTRLSIFSVSLYLRHLYKKGIKFVDLDMPDFERRMRMMNDLQM